MAKRLLCYVWAVHVGSRKLLAVWLVACLCLTWLGCGYRFVRYEEGFGDVRRVALRGFSNDSFEPLADEIVSNAIAREFLQRGALEVVDDPGRADLILVGRVANVNFVRRSSSSVSFALEYEIRMNLDVRVTRPDGSVVPIDPRALAGSELYLSSADIEVSRTFREEALREVAVVLAARLHDALFEGLAP